MGNQKNANPSNRAEISELKKYLKPRSVKLRQNNEEAYNEEFEKIIQYASDLVRLRTAAEDNFRKNRNVAKNPRFALPLDWEDINKILNPENDGPEETFLTLIARNNIQDIEATISNLRKVLIRKRKQVSISSVQEMDSECVRWLIKQPGRDIIEKAGTKQTAMAVVRFDNYNTLENRVLKELLGALLNHGKRYLNKYMTLFPEQRTVKAVKKLIKVCSEGLNLPMMSSVSSLISIPSPNYVLMQDRCYSKIWKIYQIVLKHTQLIVSLWLIKDTVYSEIDKLKKYLKDLPLSSTRFHSPIWFKPVPNKDNYFLEKPYFDNYYDSLDLHDFINKQSSSDSVIIDLTGSGISHNLLIFPSQKHENSKPFLQDFGKPSIEYVPGSDNYSAKDILYDVNFTKIPVNDGNSFTLDYILLRQDKSMLRQYFEQLYAVRGGKNWIVLIPDCWEAKWQEEIIRAIPLPRKNVYLLWRSVAAVLGTIKNGHIYSVGDEVEIVDFQKGAPVLVSRLKIANGPDGIIPQRKAFKKDSQHYTIISKNDGEVKEISREQYLFGQGIPTTIDANDANDAKSLDRRVLKSTRVKQVIVLGKNLSPKAMKIEKKPCLKELLFEEGQSLTQSGACYFNDLKSANKIAYYDELEELSIVIQNDAEEIRALTLIESDENFRGGCTYNADGDLKITDISIDRFAKEIKFYLCMGESHPDSKLKEMIHKLKPENVSDKKQGITLIPSMIPGQGMAIVSVFSQFWDSPITLDFIENMCDTDTTIASLESNMDRSFPPDLPEVLPDTEMWNKNEPEIKLYMDGNGGPNGEWFSHPKNVYRNSSFLPDKASALEIFRRKNVFGNAPTQSLPREDFDFDGFFKKLAYDYLYLPESRDTITRIIAWTYQKDNHIFQNIKSEVLCKIINYANNKCEAPLRQEYTLCANLCSTPKDWESCFDSVKVALHNEVAPSNYIWLLYNLLQFHHDFLKDTKLYKNDSCWEMIELLSEYYCKNEDREILQTYSLKAMLYLLRCRKFDGKEFLMKDIQKERYEKILKRVAIRDDSKQKLQQIFIDYLNGTGKIEGLPID